MFWSRFSSLCKENNESATQVVTSLGISHGAPTKWKRGNIPSGENLIKISEYFGVSVDYLLGRSTNNMCTLDRMQALLKVQNKTQKELCDYLGITKGTYSNWKNGLSESYKSFILEIADFFGVSTDYLLCRTDLKNAVNPTGQPLTTMQEKAVNMILSLPDSALEDLIRFVDALQGNQ